MNSEPPGGYWKWKITPEARAAVPACRNTSLREEQAVLSFFAGKIKVIDRRLMSSCVFVTQSFIWSFIRLSPDCCSKSLAKFLTSVATSSIPPRDLRSNSVLVAYHNVCWVLLYADRNSHSFGS